MQREHDAKSKDSNRGNRVTRAFGLKGDAWMRHSNPVSVWTRFAVLPLLALAIWSRDWIGWWCLIPIGLLLAWTAINPLFFKKPSSTKNWASKAVFGERVWTEGTRSSFPPEFLSRVPTGTTVFQVVGVILLAYGLIVLDPVATVTGVLVTQLAKLWFLDRMVLLFEAMKSRNSEYARWEY